MPEVLVLLITAAISGMGISFEMACVCDYLMKGSVVYQRGRGVETGCCVLPVHLLGERGPWSPLVSSCGFVKLTKALLWVASCWPKISCPSGEFYKIEPPTWVTMSLATQFTDFQQSPVRPCCSLISAWLFPQSSPAPS